MKQPSAPLINAKNACYIAFVDCVARMKKEAEMQSGGESEDYRSTLNALIDEAREITGIDPGHPKVYCIECGEDIEPGCLCTGEEIRS